MQALVVTRTIAAGLSIELNHKILILLVTNVAVAQPLQKI